MNEEDNKRPEDINETTKVNGETEDIAEQNEGATAQEGAQDNGTSNPAPVSSTESKPDSNVTSSSHQDNAPENYSSQPIMSEEEQTQLAHKMSAFPQAFPPVTSSPTAIRVTANEMEVTELKVRNICQEKSILALKMNLKSAEMKLDAKERVDEKKSRLVELLDNKLKVVDERNSKLMDMLDQMIKEKNGNSNRLKEAANNMQNLTTRLVESEKIKAELIRQNKELKTMLNCVESKGSQIAKLAKEKVLKYREVQGQMEQKISDLERGQGGAEGSQIDVMVEAAAPPKALVDCEEKWAQVIALNEQLATSFKTADAANITADKAKEFLDNITATQKALTACIEDASTTSKDNIASLSIENDQLRSLIEDFDVTRKEFEKKDEVDKDILQEQIDCVIAKDKEIAELKEELQRLKAAIGQLIGTK